MLNIGFNDFMKLVRMFRAFCALIFRSITTPILRYRQYWHIKLKWWGKLRINSTVNVHPDSTFEGANSIWSGSYFKGNMGYGTYITQNCLIEGNIGRFCSIAADVKVARGTHPIGAPYATTSPMFFSLRKQTGSTFAKKQLFDEIHNPITIGNDCWIGQGSFLVGGISIGDGAVVLAGAVVTKDVPPYAIVGGVPAQIIKYRYNEETIRFLIEKEWWNMPIEWLKNNSELLCDIDKLKQAL